MPSPRREMSDRLPRFVQPILTWITSVPESTKPPRRPKRWAIFADVGLRLVLGIAMSAAAMSPATGAVASVLLYAAGFLTTVSGMGLAQVVLYHYSAHSAIFRKVRHNEMLGRVLSVALALPAFPTYKREHLKHHLASRLITADDEYVRFMQDIAGFRPGMSRSKLWRRFLLNLTSPVFHAKFFSARLRSSLFSGDKGYGWMFASVWSLILSTAFAFNGLELLSALWFMPAVYGLQATTLFRTVIEHRIPSQIVLDKRGRRITAEATNGVFSGRRLPASRSCPFKMALWWADMLTLKTLARFLVLVGDAPCHDYHHRRVTPEWSTAEYGRLLDKESWSPGDRYPQNYVDVWGLVNGVDATFRSWAQADPDCLGPSSSSR